MVILVRIAREAVGELMDGEKYCLKLLLDFGGEFKSEHISKIPQIEQIGFSGDIAKQLKDTPDGTKYKIEIK